MKLNIAHNIYKTKLNNLNKLEKNNQGKQNNQDITINN